MSPEAIPFPEPKKTVTTPESLQECEDLEGAIDTQLKDWRKFSATRHPTVVQKSLRKFIYNQCNPPQESIENDPRGDPRDTLIQPVIHDVSLDTFQIEDEDYRDFFERVAGIIHNSGVPQELEEVITYLHRLFIMREALAAHHSSDDGEYKEPFHAVAYRLLEEIF